LELPDAKFWYTVYFLKIRGADKKIPFRFADEIETKLTNSGRHEYFNLFHKQEYVHMKVPR
jgi:hypothetical protein